MSWSKPNSMGHGSSEHVIPGNRLLQSIAATSAAEEAKRAKQKPLKLSKKTTTLCCKCKIGEHSSCYSKTCLCPCNSEE